MSTLDFDPPRSLRGSLGAPPSGWSNWFDGLERRPSFACLWSGPEVSGYAQAPRRIGGYFVEPLESVIGLRPFDDALEGTVALEGVERDVPYVFFEVEKLLRMMLHQSGLALEILASPGWLLPASDDDPCGAPRAIVEGAIHTGILAHYRETAAPPSAEGLDERSGDAGPSIEELFQLVREAGIGAALTRGRVSLDLGRLAEEFGIDVPASSGAVGDGEVLREAGARFGEILAGSEGVLPESPADYDGLDAWLVDRRLRRRARDSGTSQP